MTSSLTYIPFFKILKILDFIAKTKHFFPKKLFFVIFVVKNSKFRQSEIAISYNYSSTIFCIVFLQFASQTYF